MCRLHGGCFCSTRTKYSWILHAAFVLGSVVGSRDASSQPVTSRRQLRVVTIQASPYIGLRWQPGLIGNDRYEGNHVSIVRAVTSELDWSLRIQLAPDGKLGSRSSEDAETGWDGMVGEILRGTADLAVGPLTITRERAAVVSFTQTISEIQLTLLSSQPTGVNSRLRTTTLEPVEARLQPLSGFKYGVVRGSETERLLRNADDEISQRLWETINENYNDVTVENIFEGLERVRKEKFGLVLDATTARYFSRQEPCDLNTAGSWPTGKHYAFATRKNSPLLVDINNVITRMKENSAAWERIVNGVEASTCHSSSDEQQRGNSGGGNNRKREDFLTFSPTAQPHLRITTTIMPPFVQRVEQTIHTDEERLDGYIPELLRHLAASVPFTFNLRLVRDADNMGRRHRDGTYSGILGELIRNEIDMAAAPFTDNKKYLNYIEYTKPFMHSTLSMLMRSPRQGEEFPFLFLEDLVNQTAVEVGILKHSPIHTEFQSATDPLHAAIWNKIKMNRRLRLVSMKKGLRKVRSQHYILLLPSTDASYWTSKIPCDLMSLDQFMMVTNYMFALPKDSQLTERISAALLKLQEDGVLQRLFHKWWNSEECVGFTDSGYHFHVENNNDTRPTDASFVNVRKQTTTEMLLPPPPPSFPPMPGGGDMSEAELLSHVSPIVESSTEYPTHSRNNANRHSSASVGSSSQTTNSVQSTTSLAPNTNSDAGTTNRHRHGNSRHSNRGSSRRNHGVTSPATTPYPRWGHSVDRIPDYIEGMDSPSVVPVPDGLRNQTVPPPVRYTFRAITYTVPTTLTTTHPQPGKNKGSIPPSGSKGRSRNRVTANKDNSVQEDTFQATGNRAQESHCVSNIIMALACVCILGQNNV